MMKELVGVCVCFSLATATLYKVAEALSMEMRNGPPLSFPTSMDDLRLLSGQLQELKERHYYHVLGLFVTAYLYKQTFAIPGSVFMNVLGGALFGVRWGLPLVCLLTATGATFCYFLSLAFGRKLVMRYLQERILPLQEKLSNDHRSLLFVLISVRLFPMSPNWLLNIASPIVGVPLHLFFVSVLIGLAPYNYLCVQAGLILSELHVVTDILRSREIFLLIALTIILLMTALIIRRYNNRKS